MKRRFPLLHPDAFCESIYHIDTKALSDRGITNLLIDIDNTLVEWNGREVPERLIEWIDGLLEKGFSICALSNNQHFRVSKFAGSLGLPFVALAGKPRVGPYRKAMRLIGAGKNNTAVIGDQIFTDVFGGNRAGLHTILVSPIGRDGLWWTRQVRKIESRFLAGVGVDDRG